MPRKHLHTQTFQKLCCIKMYTSHVVSWLQNNLPNKNRSKFYVQLLYFNIRTNWYTQQIVCSTAPPKCLEDKAQTIITNSLKAEVQSANQQGIAIHWNKDQNNKPSESSRVVKIIRGYWNISPLYRRNGDS